VRELENLCERITLTCSGGRLDGHCLPAAMLQAGAEADCEGSPIAVSLEPAPAAHPPADDDLLPVSLDDRMRELEADLISWALRVTAGNKSRAAKLLKIKRSTLGDRFNRCGLKVAEAAANARRLRASA
jgi:DNA-binding NtrC family response regulator